MINKCNMFYQANDFVKAPNLMVLLMIKSVIVTITIIFGSNVSTVVINFTVFNPQMHFHFPIG